MNRPVILPENQALFRSLHKLLLTNSHVVSNSELQCKKFSYRMVNKVAANGTYHKTYANTSCDPPFSSSSINFNMMYYECTSTYLEQLSPAKLYSEGSCSKIDR